MIWDILEDAAALVALTLFLASVAIWSVIIAG